MLHGAQVGSHWRKATHHVGRNLLQEEAEDPVDVHCKARCVCRSRSRSRFCFCLPCINTIPFKQPVLLRHALRVCPSVCMRSGRIKATIDCCDEQTPKYSTPHKQHNSFFFLTRRLGFLRFFHTGRHLNFPILCDLLRPLQLLTFYLRCLNCINECVSFTLSILT